MLRTAVAPGLLLSLRHNVSQGAGSLRLFEVARTFARDGSGPGPWSVPAWPFSSLRRAPRRRLAACPGEDADYADLKGLVEHLAASFRLPAPVCELKADHSYYLPCVEVSVAGRVIGRMGRVRPEIAEDYHARKDVWMAEIDLPVLRGLMEGSVPAFPALAGLPARAPRPDPRGSGHAARPAGPGGRPGQEAGAPRSGLPARRLRAARRRRTNLTLRFTYRSADRTLSDKEVDKVHAGVANALVTALPVKFHRARLARPPGKEGKSRAGCPSPFFFRIPSFRAMGWKTGEQDGDQA